MLQNNSKFQQVFNQANLYIFLWCLYYAQGTFYPSGSIISQGVLIVLLLMSMKNYFIAFTKYKLPLYFHGLNVLLLMFVLYGIGLILSGERLVVREYYTYSSNYEYLKAILISLLPAFSAYVYAKKGLFTLKSLKYWVPIWLIIAVISYYSYERNALSLIVSRDEVTNNIAYRFVALMPVFVIFYKKPLFMVLGLLFCLLFILMGMKRGAIVIAALNLMFVIYQLYKTGNAQMKKYIILSFVCILVVLFFVVKEMLSTSEYFVARVDATLEGNSSGRDQLFSVFWNYYLNQDSIINLLFGNGANATLRIGSNAAHNDWLEILINQGLFGVYIYIYYFFNFYKSLLYKKVGNPFYYIGLKMIFLVTLLSTFFSMSYGTLDIFLTLTLGFFLANIPAFSRKKTVLIV